MSFFGCCCAIKVVFQSSSPVEKNEVKTISWTKVVKCFIFKLIGKFYTHSSIVLFLSLLLFIKNNKQKFCSSLLVQIKTGELAKVFLPLHWTLKEIWEKVSCNKFLFKKETWLRLGLLLNFKTNPRFVLFCCFELFWFILLLHSFLHSRRLFTYEYKRFIVKSENNIKR